ncbi:discoidin domain-containing protein [Clostridium sardiniense]|uniref:Beta-N-acetylhexosaminidase n=1 Tax=Clostridium sardiniense TaxID=29369 RepID=A0ABS7L0W8_CLOSR|nr:discoidin domain-containing protein [Clostridium sardiniense]MBY0756715.1 discoidin domain-containing protein [Clostridium sardiniense]MDQ0458535.1 hexosaminidase [Clostridium sardiniense]
MQYLKRNKRFKLMLPLFLIFTMMCGNMAAYATALKNKGKLNLALGKSTFASSEETSDFSASKINDGIIDRTGEKQSRWACERYEENPWVAIDFGEKTKFNQVVIEWERKNIESYRIEVSDDKTSWISIYEGSKVENYNETIDLGNQEARYLRVLVESYMPKEEGSDIEWETVSLYEVEVYGDAEEPTEGVNVALNKEATASSVETNTFTASKATDGIIDRGGAKSSRWASAVSSEDQWLKVDLGANTQFNNVVIEWERKNSPKYRIQTSVDNENWVDVYTATKAPDNHRDEIKLNEKVSGRYVRLYIDEHIANSEGVNWNTVSVYEIEIYNGKIPEAPKTVQEVANSIKVEELSAEDTKLKMPEVPEGFEISFIGADYEEVIDYEMNIHKPLVNTKVSMNFEVKKGNEKATSKAIELTVPGSNMVSVNDKPTVIPELREWAGMSGNFEIKDNSRIVISKDSESKLRSVAETFAKDYKDIVGRDIEVVVSNSPKRGDFYLSLTSNYKELRKEGYYMEIGDAIKVEANEAQGIFLSTRTILQILKQNKNYIPKGLVRDYPQYDVRGFMLDVGRKFTSLDYLYEIMKTMSWYKMNDFQIHLNDNYIWLDEYGSEALEKAYAGFRLESNDVGSNGVALTSKDGHYTKEQFGKFIDDSSLYGVNIVPEFDTPGHALAFTKVHPEYAYGNGHGENAAMLDVNNENVVNYIKSIYNEFMDGENPVFRNSTVHIGTDEFYGNAEEYRAYTDKILKFMRDEKKAVPRLWGSLTNKKGSTPVTSEGVQMNIWNCGWANPKDMYNQGFDLINTDDAWVYIVPGANYYRNYLDTEWLYNNWQANKFGNGVVLPEGSPQMLGGMFTLWNDMIDRKSNGIVEYDIFDRVYPAIQALSEKMWGEAEDKTYNEFKEVSKKVGTAPNTNPTFKVESKTEKVINYDFENAENNIADDKSENGYNSLDIKNAEIKNGSLKLNGGESILKTPINNIGPNYSISFSVNRDNDSSNEEQVLFESSKGQFKAVQKKTGKVGFSRENYDYSFNYELPKGEWVDITIVGKLNKTELYVNGEYVDEISKSSETNNFGTFVFPLENIGSSSKAFKGEFDNLLVNNKAALSDPLMIPQEQMHATASSEHPNVGSEGLASFAIDGDEGTMWHTNYNNVKPLPQYITLDLGGKYNIDRLTYLPRQSGQNGNITKYEVQVSTNGEDFVKVSEGSFENNNKLKTVKLNDVAEATHVRLIAKEGVGGFASAAELNVYRSKDASLEGNLNVTVPEEVLVGNNFDVKFGTGKLNSDNIFAMEFDVEFDNEKAEFVEATSMDSEKYIVSSKEVENKIKVIVATKGTPIESDKDIAKLSFKAKAEGNDVQFNAVNVKIADGEGKEHSINGGSAITNIKNEVVKPVDKKALKMAIDYAEDAKANGALNGVIPAVIIEFNKSLDLAKEVYNKEDATKVEVNDALKKLMNVIHMLEFKQGDKELLKGIVDIIETLKKSDYIETTWAPLEEALKEAQDVLADENAMQPEVDKAFDSLMKAYLDLRLKPDKSKLEELINEIKGMDLSKYTEASVKNLNEAVNKGEEVLNNEDATKQDINNAIKLLKKAKAGLEEKTEKPGDNGDNEEPEDNNGSENKPGENNNGTNGGNNSSTGDNNKPNGGEDSGNVPATGGMVQTGLLLAGIMSAAGGVVMLRRKRK